MWNQAFFSLPSETKFSLQFQILLPKWKWGHTLVYTPPAASSLSKERTSIQNNQNLGDLDFFSISKLDANACNSAGYIIPVRRISLLKLSENATQSSQQELQNFCAGQSSRIIKNSTSLNKLRKINSQNNKTEIMKKCTCRNGLRHGPFRV